MSTKQTISRDDLKHQMPALYQGYLTENEISPLKEQAIIEFDITKSPKWGHVRIVGVHYSELKTMYCDECGRQYSENEYYREVKAYGERGIMPCGHDVYDCYNIESSEVK